MIISQTPLRVSLAGGGTDFPEFYRTHGGAVLSAAIDKYVYLIVKERFDSKIYVNYSARKEVVDSAAEIKHGLVREAMHITGVNRGVEVTTLADVPSEGSGLGSSSSITVGLLIALYAYRGENQPAHVIARQACEIELDRLGSPIGKQDQYAAAFGGLNVIRFHPDDTVTVEKIRIEPQHRHRLFQNLMLFYLGGRAGAHETLRAQTERTQENTSSLRKILELVERLRQALERGEVDETGPILNEGWQTKRELAPGITNGWIDDAYKRALDAGATGGKVAGAGGGGFLVLYCPQDRQDDVRNVLAEMRMLPVDLSRDGGKIIFNVRR